MYPREVLYLTHKGDLKMNNIIALLLRTKKQTRVGAAPEMYLQDLDENAGS